MQRGLRKIVPHSSSPIHLLGHASTDPEIAAFARLDGEIGLISHDGSITGGASASNVTAVSCFGPPENPTIIASGSSGIAVHQRGHSCVLETLRHEGRVTGVAALLDDASCAFAVSGDERGQLQTFELTSGKPTCTVRAHRKAVNVLHVVPANTGGAVVLTASDDRDIAVHTLPELDEVARIGLHAGWVEQVVPVVQDGALAGAVAVDRVGVTVWDLGERSALVRHRGKVRGAVAVRSVDGVAHVAAAFDDHVWVWSSGASHECDVPGGARSVAFVASAHGSAPDVLILCGNDLLLWKTGQSMATHHVGLDADGQRLFGWAAGSTALCALQDGSVWEVST